MSEITATKEQQNKYEALKEYLRSLESVAVAFSSGVDSTFLLKTAHDVLGDKCIAITAMSCSFPKRELEEAKTFCEKEGIRHITVESEELEIEEKLLQNPMTLSGGQQQRVAIARAIYTHPTILLGDELTGNLDSTTSISVMKFLKKMCKKYSQTMIIVTHDERIAAMADRIIQMKDGRVV